MLTGLKNLSRYRHFYLMLVPALIFYVLFCYLPMYGLTLAFKEFDYSKGILGSPWTGLDNLADIVRYPDFWAAFGNTLIIAAMRLAIEFPIPILLALLINEVRLKFFRNVVQTVFTFPHFISWIIISGMALSLFGDQGVWNQLMDVFGLKKNNFLSSNETFRWFLVFSNLWKEAGWGTIIYLAALAGISPELYEAAEIDGANRFQQLKAIALPALLPVAGTMLVLFLSTVMNSGGGGFDQIFNLYHPGVYDSGDILDTYIYRRTFQEGFTFGSSTAVGLIKSVINAALVLAANEILKKTNGEGLF